MNEKILLVDDELKALKAYERNLSLDFDVSIESSPEFALMRLEHEGPFAAIMSDYKMPKMNGNDLLSKSRELAPDTVRIMLTGYADLNQTIQAVNEGSVFRFLTKPCPLPSLKRCLDDAVRQHQLITAEKELLGQTLNGSIKVLLDILTILDHHTFSLAQKRRKAAKLIASTMKAKNLWSIEIACLLADIGIVTLPNETLKRYHEGKTLDDCEKKMVEDLPQTSAKLVQRIPRLDDVSNIILYQNKNYDGSGTPKNDVKEHGIPIGARILRVVNDYFRIITKGSSPHDAMEMLGLAPDQYDPEVLKALRLTAMRLNPPKKDSKSLRKIGHNGLKVGQTLRSDVYSKSGFLIVKANQILGSVQLQRLNNFASSEGIVEPIIVED